MSETTPVELTLYYAPRSRSFSALWLLEELGEEYRLESFNIDTARHKKADYLALNPMGKVPLVVDRDTPISELGAIAIYLSDCYPRAQLSPLIEDPQRPAYLRWTFFSSTIMEPAFSSAVTRLIMLLGRRFRSARNRVKRARPTSEIASSSEMSSDLISFVVDPVSNFRTTFDIQLL